MRTFMTILRWLLALVFAVTAGLKLGSPSSAETLFGVLPAWGRWTVIAAELGLAGWLVSGVWPRLSSLAAIVLLSTFLAVILIELDKPQPKPCGCEGGTPVIASRDPATVRKRLLVSLAQDVGLLAGAVAVYFAAGTRSPRVPH